MKWWKGSGLAAVAIAVATLAAVTSADARVRHDGTWPATDKVVSLDVDGAPRSEALRKLADAAGWSLVVHAPPGDKVDIHVKSQPASKVLDLLLDDGDYVATRDGTLVAIEHDAASAPAASATSSAAASAGIAVPPVPPVPPVPSLPPVPGAAASAAFPAPASTDMKIQLGGKSSEIDEPHKHGQDRTVMGGDVRIAKGEIARDVTVFGGNVDIEGEATGDVSVFGGSVHVHDGARIKGDATVFGGELELDPGASVDGDVSALGGEVKRDPGAHIGGDVTVKGGAEDHPTGAGAPAKASGRSRLSRAAESVMDGVRLAAVLFVIGTVLIALTGRRMDALRGEVAARPMRSLALGLLGSFAALLVFIALCVTVIGAPVAIVGALVFGFAVLGAMCAVLSVVGEGLLRHKTQNPYVHLAAGCALFVALSAIPWVGGFLVVAVLLIAVGTLVATRCAGLLVKKNGNGGAPYRSPEAV